MRNAGHRCRWTAFLRSRMPLLGLVAFVVGPPLGTPDVASAAEPTRTLTFLHTHTNESATVTFRRNGGYDQTALDQVNWLLRDWRVNEPARMDPRLLDIVWQAQRETGSTGPVHVISAYRSPQTNRALRHRSKGVSEQSQHMSGKAIDIRLPDVPTARLRETAMRLQAGGVGFYPGSDFVHVDTGSVRAWPRMSREQLARLFPDGKTVHLPSTGAPLAGYEQARAEILARDKAGQTAPAQVVTAGQNVWAALFGGAPDANSRQTVAGLTEAAPQPRSGMTTASISPPLPPARPRNLGGTSHASVVISVPEASGSERDEPASGDADSLRVFFAPATVSEPERVHVYQTRGRPRVLDRASLELSDAGVLNVHFRHDDSRELGFRQFIGPAVRPLPISTAAGLPG